jgi:hypothetical protein
MIHFNCLESAEMIMRGRFTDQGGLFRTSRRISGRSEEISQICVVVKSGSGLALTA